MSKHSLYDAFNITRKVNDFSNLSDYDIFPDKKLLDTLRTKIVENLIDKACFSYDVVLIDMNHTLSELNIVTLDKVDNILFLMTNDPMDLKNMKSIIMMY